LAGAAILRKFFQDTARRQPHYSPRRTAGAAATTVHFSFNHQERAMPARSSQLPQYLLTGLGVAVLAATYIYLVRWRPEGLSDGTGGGATAAMIGNTVGALLVLAGAARRLTALALALIPSAIAVNIVLGQAAIWLNLPLYLDSIGTVLVAAMAGPAPAVAAGVLSNVVWGLTLAPVSAAFAATAGAIGALAGCAARAGAFERVYSIPFVGLAVGVIAALVSAPITAFVFEGVTGGSATSIVSAFQAMGHSLLGSTTIQGLLLDPLDKAIAFTTAAALFMSLPARLRPQRDPRERVATSPS
jgi:energy-coupling factor transport system substrate-specific component